jgi:hypothetical protein
MPRMGYHRAQVHRCYGRCDDLNKNFESVRPFTSAPYDARTMLVRKPNLGLLHALLLGVLCGLHNARNYTNMLVATALGRYRVSNIDLFAVLVRHWHFSMIFLAIVVGGVQCAEYLFKPQLCHMDMMSVLVSSLATSCHNKIPETLWERDVQNRTCISLRRLISWSAGCSSLIKSLILYYYI